MGAGDGDTVGASVAHAVGEGVGLAVVNTCMPLSNFHQVGVGAGVNSRGPAWSMSSTLMSWRGTRVSPPWLPSLSTTILSPGSRRRHRDMSAMYSSPTLHGPRAANAKYESTIPIMIDAGSWQSPGRQTSLANHTAQQSALHHWQQAATARACLRARRTRADDESRDSTL